jgi:hypothetical protein
MTIALAATYDPRGEIPRIQRYWPQLQQAYSALIMTLPPHVLSEDHTALSALPGVRLIPTPEWSHGRYLALQAALETDAAHVHYADMDKLIRWVETQPAEWQHILARIPTVDCLVTGRTPTAWATHPRAMQITEGMANTTFSHLLGRPVDLGAGSKGFSRRAVALLMKLTQPGRAIGTDSEWPVLLWRAGYTLDTALCEGLDWETADRYRDTAADPQTQHAKAAERDADPQEWAYRATIAQEIIEKGIEALTRPLPSL